MTTNAISGGNLHVITGGTGGSAFDGNYTPPLLPTPSPLPTTRSDITTTNQSMNNQTHTQPHTPTQTQHLIATISATLATNQTHLITTTINSIFQHNGESRYHPPGVNQNTPQFLHTLEQSTLLCGPKFTAIDCMMLSAVLRNYGCKIRELMFCHVMDGHTNPSFEFDLMPVRRLLTNTSCQSTHPVYQHTHTLSINTPFQSTIHHPINSTFIHNLQIHILNLLTPSLTLSPTSPSPSLSSPFLSRPPSPLIPPSLFHPFLTPPCHPPSLSFPFSPPFPPFPLTRLWSNVDPFVWFASLAGHTPPPSSTPSPKQYKQTIHVSMNCISKD